jgi:glucokinase
MKINVGVDIGGTSIKTGLVNSEGKVLAQHKTATEPARGNDRMIQSIIETIQKLLIDNCLSINQIGSVGVGVPGTVDSKQGLVVFAPNIFWNDLEIASAFRSALDVPIYLGQDSRAAVWGEYLVGSGKGYRNIAGLTLGTGIGCGMIINGRLFHGGLNTAGEFGHQIVEIDGNPCNCGRTGCLEAHAAGLAIVREGKKINYEITVKDVFDLAMAGYVDAKEIVKNVVKYLGVGIVNLINLNSPELICISGGISNAPDELLFNPLKDFVLARAYSAAAGKVKIVKSVLGENAPMIGAALLNRETEFERIDHEN